MSQTHEQRAAAVVRAAQSGQLGDAGRDLLGLFVEAVRKGGSAEGDRDDARARLREIEREANALAAVLADVLDLTAEGGTYVAREDIDVAVGDLPHDARRRVTAYRHAARLGQLGANGYDQFGALPRVPPRSSVMRERVRTLDLQPSRTEDGQPTWSTA